MHASLEDKKVNEAFRDHNQEKSGYRIFKMVFVVIF
jgi:hypothetical protein